MLLLLLVAGSVDAVTLYSFPSPPCKVKVIPLGRLVSLSSESSQIFVTVTSVLSNVFVIMKPLSLTFAE